MIKFMQCIRRQPTLSAAEFRRHWDHYKGVWVELARASEASRMVTSVGLDIDHNTTIQLARGTREPFDGVLEVWWASGEHVNKCMQDPGLKSKLASMRQLQEQFIDLSNSSFFFALEEDHLGGG
jgi:EthD domain